TLGGNTLIDLEYMDALPWNVFAGKSTKHYPWRVAATDSHDETTASSNGLARLGGDYRRCFSSYRIGVGKHFNSHRFFLSNLGGRRIAQSSRFLLFRRCRIVPASGRCEALRLGRTPGVLFVLVGRSCGLQHRIDNPPCFLDIVFASEQCPVASYGLSEDAL